MANDSSFSLQEATNAPADSSSSFSLSEAVGPTGAVAPAGSSAAPASQSDDWDAHWYSPITTLPGRIEQALSHRMQQEDAGMFSSPSKMSPEDVSAYTKLFGNPQTPAEQRLSDVWGVPASQNYPVWRSRFIGSNTDFKKWWAGNAPKEVKNIQNPLKLWVTNSLPANVSKYVFNGPYYETMKYNAVKSYQIAQNVLKNPGNFSPQQVKLAQTTIKELTNKGESFQDNLKNLYQTVIHHPKDFGVSLVNGILADPELLFSGRIWSGPIESILGRMAVGAGEGSTINAAISAAQQLEATGKIQAGQTESAALSGLGIGALASSLHLKGGKPKVSVEDMPDHTGGQGTPPPAGGATPPPAEDFSVEEAIRGIAKGKSADEVSPADQGAVGGGAPGAEGAAGPKADDTATLAKQAAEENSTPKAPEAQDKIPQQNPGEMLHPYRRIDTSRNVDLGGGVTHDGTIVISREIPQYVDAGGVQVDAHDAIAYHERVEYPLMHLDKPMDDAGLKLLRSRIGNKLIPKNMYAKLKAGRPLTYQEAHYIATLAENHYVSTRYGIDPELYQKAVMPFVERAKEAAQREGGAHFNIDDKPNRDSGELDDLHNAQRPIEGDLANDPELQALAKNSNQPDLFEPQNNASGESAASIEAINRVREDIAKGRIRIKIYPNGQVVPLIGVDAVDEVAHPGEIIAQRGIGPDSNDWTILDQGKNVSNTMAKIRLNKAKPAIAELESGKIDPDLLFRMGLMGAGGLAGAYAYKKHPIAGGLAGVLAGLALPFGGKLSMLDNLRQSGAVNSDGFLSGIIPDNAKLPNEESLLEQAKAGNHAAFNKLAGQYYNRLVRAMRPLANSTAKVGMGADDIAQEALIRAYKNLPNFRGDSDFYTWLHRIGLNVGYNAIEAGKRQVDIKSPTAWENTGREGMDPEDQMGHQVQADMEQVSGGATTPETIAIGNDTVNLLKNAMQKLPANQRLAVDLGDFQGLSDQEIADQLGVPRATVASWLNRAHESISQYLQSEGNTRYIGPKNQRGMASVDSLKRLVLMSAGAGLGAYYGHDWKDVLGGAILGAGASAALTRGTWEAIKNIGNKSSYISIKGLSDANEGDIGTGFRAVAILQHAIHNAAPSEESRIKITRWLDGDKTVQLDENEMKAAKMAQNFFNYIKSEGLKHGVLKSVVQDYVTHLWGDSPAVKSFMEKLFGAKAGDRNMSAQSRFALERKFSTLAEGKAAGLTPQTEDIRDIIGIYGRSMIRAIANKKFLEALKDQQDPEGNPLIAPAGKAPSNYVRINHPQLSRMAVHPGIAAEMKFLFSAEDPSSMLTAIEGINTALKRNSVSFSFFHGKALADAAMATHWNPLTSLRIIAESALGKTKFQKMILGGKPGDIIDTAIRAGLRFQMRHGTGVDPDVTEGFYPALEGLQRWSESIIPGAGKLAGAAIKINKLADRFLWENLHAGLKLSVFSKNLELLKENWAKEKARNPNAQVPSDAELAETAAMHTNDLFGGLNWRRVAEDARTEIGRKLKLAALSPAGRKSLELAMFAPDWTIATFRSFYKAIGRGSGFRGLLEPKTIADLHRLYVIRSAIYYLATGDAINYSMSGHHIWQNEDPTMIDLGDGRKMQWSKHAMEGVDWMMKPRQMALNKLGIIPKEGLEQLLDVKWLSAKGHAPPIKDRLGHAAANLIPIAPGSYSQGGMPGVVSSFLGAPIYGAPHESSRMKSIRMREARRLNNLRRPR